MNRDIQINSFIRGIVVVQIIATTACVVAACADPQMIYAAVGMLTLMITLVPFLLMRTYDLFSPWSFVILAVISGCTFQSVCMSIGWPSMEAIDATLLLGKDPEYFMFPAGIFLAGFVCFTVGYFWIGSDSGKPRQISREFNRGNLTLIIGACFLISIVATLAYIRITGGMESSKISSKRTVIKTLDVGEDSETRQYGYLKQLGKLSTITFLVLYSYFVTRNEKLRLSHVCILAFVFCLASVIPFYASMRAAVIWLVLSALGVTYYHDRKNFAFGVAVFATIGLSAFVVMSLLRNTGEDEVWGAGTFEDTARRLLFNRNGPGFSKTAHLINHIPEPLEYQYGKTIAVWLIAPVPRELYPNKPMVHTGPIIGRTIYDTHMSGVPPGLIGELYWNFYIPGVVFGMLFIGWLMRRVYSLFRNCYTDYAILTPIYLFSIIPIGYSIIGHSLGYGTIMRVVDFVSVAFVVYLCTSPAVLQFVKRPETGRPVDTPFGNLPANMPTAPRLR